MFFLFSEKTYLELSLKFMAVEYVGYFMKHTCVVNVVRTRGGGVSGVKPLPTDDWKKLKTALFGPISVFSCRDCAVVCCVKLPIYSRATFIVVQQ